MLIHLSYLVRSLHLYKKLMIHSLTNMLQTGLVLCVRRIVIAGSVYSYRSTNAGKLSVLSLERFEFSSSVTDRISVLLISTLSEFRLLSSRSRICKLLSFMLSTMFWVCSLGGKLFTFKITLLINKSLFTVGSKTLKHLSYTGDSPFWV